LDIGCGDDPVRPDVEPFDVDQGDANCVTQFITDLESYDYVFSSHCLEHMYDPLTTIADWWKLVKPEGTMFVVVPDEDLYEQGYWPSLFNSDHKATFTISKQSSWSPVSRNLMDLARALPDAEIVSVRLQDHRYERKYLAPGLWPHGVASYAVAVATISRGGFRRCAGCSTLCLLFRPIDQTVGTRSPEHSDVTKRSQRRRRDSDQRDTAPCAMMVRIASPYPARSLAHATTRPVRKVA
jgi:SAM-dependent methyltransferase